MTDFSEQASIKTRNGLVHALLSHSYLFYFFSILFGIILDIFYPMNMFSRDTAISVGFMTMTLGSLIVYWAQSTSNCSKKEMCMNNTARNFAKGPYRFTRNPTHLGLSILTLGFGLVIQSVFTVILVAVMFIVIHFFFLKKEEQLLEEKYGSTYCDYKAKVRTWL